MHRLFGGDPLAGFDQYVLGAGTKAGEIIASHHRAGVSRAARWISPVVVAAGRVGRTWHPDGRAVHVRLFEDAGRVPRTLECGVRPDREAALSYGSAGVAVAICGHFIEATPPIAAADRGAAFTRTLRLARCPWSWRGR